MYTIIHAIVGYFILLLVVRILSRRPGGQLTPFEFVIIFLIGGLIIATTAGNDKSITNCVCAIITIGLMHRITAQVRSRYARLSAAVDGVPLILLNQGRWHTEAMHNMRLDHADVMAVARSRGHRNLSTVRYAILERLGSISLISEVNPESEAEPDSDTENPKANPSQPSPSASTTKAASEKSLPENL